MSHLNDVELMSVSAGRPEGTGLVEHVASCALCRERQELLEREAVELRQRLGYQRTRVRVEALGRRPSSRRWGLWAGAAVAASVALFLRLSPSSEVSPIRYKGGAQVQLVRAPGATGPVKANERVFLRVATSGHPFVLVLAVDETGAVDPVWPPQGSASGRVQAQGGAAVLEPGFDVTPGSFALHAFFSDEALSLDAARAALSKALSEQGVGAIRALTPAPAEGEKGHAQLFVEVPATPQAPR